MVLILKTKQSVMIQGGWCSVYHSYTSYTGFTDTVYFKINRCTCTIFISNTNKVENKRMENLWNIKIIDNEKDQLKIYIGFIDSTYVEFVSSLCLPKPNEHTKLTYLLYCNCGWGKILFINIKFLVLIESLS